jgi:hypothetical protein
MRSRGWPVWGALLAIGCAAAPASREQLDLDFEVARVVARDPAPEHAASLPTAAGAPAASRADDRHSAPVDPIETTRSASGVVKVGYLDDEAGLMPQPALAPPADPLAVPVEQPAPALPAAPDVSNVSALPLEAVVGSVYTSYPLLMYALYSRNIAAGEQLAASGAFDLKIIGATENGPTGYYQTYRQSIGVAQPLYGGGEVFAGYRIGRGDFQPWYLERQTNDGGEFKAGIGIPLLQNVDIDPRRAALWQAEFGRYLAEPEIQAQLIQFVQEASYAYWDWVAAGANYRVAVQILDLAEERTSRIESQVNAGLIDPPELTDNLRLVAERRAKLADARRKVDQTAAKLSLFLRDASGRPQIPTIEQLPEFPDPGPDLAELTAADIQRALASRPEFKALAWQRRQIETEYALAENMTLPELDAVLSGSQDVGYPTSKKRDKSQFELEAALYLDVPLQRRKA